MLVAAGFFERGLATIELPDGDPQPVPLPGPFPVVAGYFLSDGSVLAVLERGPDGVRAYRSSPGGRPVALGPPLRGPFTFSLGGDLLLAADCGSRPSAFVLDVASPSRWRRVEGACGAVLSPDGASIAWPSDGHTLFEGTVSATTGPHEVLDVARVRGLPPSMGDGVTIGGDLEWGEPGLAIAVETDQRQAAIVVGAGGRVDVAPLGKSAAGLRSGFAWQPEGGLLAIASWSNLEGIVRLFAPGEAKTRVVALLSDPLAGLAWSPNGDLLLAATDSWWTFVAPDGTWIGSIPMPRGDWLPIAWRR